MKAHACGKDVADWCVAWGLPRSLTLSFAKYSEQLAVALATLWCELLQCLYDSHRQDGHFPVDVAVVVGALPAVAGVRRLCDGLPASHAGRSKLDELLRIRPANST